MRTIHELDDTELQNEYVFTTRRYNEAYKQKKEIEEEMYRRYEKRLEENHE